MHTADIKKTEITTPTLGLLEFTRMTFVMSNPGNTFQFLMDHMMAVLENPFPYLDDILI